MDELTEVVQIRVTEEMKQRADTKDGYGSQSEYARQMWLAGESTVGALDPRVGDSTAVGTTEIDSAEAAAKALDDTVLLNALSTDDPEALDEAIEPIIQEFENVIVDRIIELRDDDNSAVTDDGRGNYYLEG